MAFLAARGSTHRLKVRPKKPTRSAVTALVAVHAALASRSRGPGSSGKRAGGRLPGAGVCCIPCLADHLLRNPPGPAEARSPEVRFQPAKRRASSTTPSLVPGTRILSACESEVCLPKPCRDGSENTSIAFCSAKTSQYSGIPARPYTTVLLRSKSMDVTATSITRTRPREASDRSLPAFPARRKGQVPVPTPAARAALPCGGARPTAAEV